MDLYLFRISLKEREQSDVFERLDDGGERFTREGWLRDFFQESQVFVHRRQEFRYVPEEEVSFGQKLVFGWIAREKLRSERTHPDEGLEPTYHPSWQAAFIALDPTDHPDGQKIAIEDNPEVGDPNPIISSLVKAMNARPTSERFSAQVFPIVEEASFWRFAELHGGKIKRISFDVAAPNMFRGRDDFQDELRSLKDGENVARVRATLESDGALKHDTERMQEIVDYTEKGAGKLIATAVDGSSYNSDRYAKHITATVEHHSKDKNSFLEAIVEFLDRVF